MGIEQFDGTVAQDGDQGSRIRRQTEFGVAAIPPLRRRKNRRASGRDDTYK